jgi:hypothetical protein
MPIPIDKIDANGWLPALVAQGLQKIFDERLHN